MEIFMIYRLEKLDQSLLPSPSKARKIDAPTNNVAKPSTPSKKRKNDEPPKDTSHPFKAQKVNYGSLTLVQLREELKKRQVKTSGKKKDLVDRYAIKSEVKIVLRFSN